MNFKEIEKRTIRKLEEVNLVQLELDSYTFADDEDGVWRTINGSPIFIAKGQSVEDALKSKKTKSNTSKLHKVETEYAISVKDYASQSDFNDSGTDAINYNKVEKDIRKSLPKNINVKNIEFIETDSGNYTHAGAYFRVELEGGKNDLKKVVGEDKDFFADPNSIELIKKGKNGK